MPTVIDIDYTPRNWAQKLHESTKRFFSLIIHRRAGKTTAIVNHIQRSALDDNWEKERIRAQVPHFTDVQIKPLLKNRFYGIVFPTYSQAELVAWPMLKEFSRPIPGIKKNEVDLEVSYPNGSRVRLFGVENADKLRGIGLSGVAFDEYSQQPPHVFGEIISKALADHLGYAIFAGTIQGKNQLYKTHEVAKNNPMEWDYIWQDIDTSFRTEKGTTIVVLKRALEDDKRLVAQGMMTEEEFMQEWYLSVEAAIRGSIFGKQLARAREHGRITAVPYDRAIKVHTAWDLGKGEHMAIGFYQVCFGQVKMIDYWEGQGSDGLPEAIKEVKNKPYVYGKHFAPHDIQSTDISTGTTRFETAKKLGIVFETLPAVPIGDRINAGKLLFDRLWIDKVKCNFFIEAIPHYKKEFDNKRGIFKDNPLHNWASHAADQFTYAALAEQKMIDEVTGGEDAPYNPPKWME